jgi:hypothetical protein
MVILIIQQGKRVTIERKGQPPISANPHRENFLAPTFQLVQFPTRWAWEGSYIFCNVQRAQLGKQLVGVRGLNAAQISALKEPFQSSVLEGFNHL